ncbi:hypothetical protein BD770DRAFT_461902, partial [Pilaira anomala]
MDEQSTFTRSQAEEIFRELEEQRAQERKLQANGTDLPLEIYAKSWTVHLQHNLGQLQAVQENRTIIHITMIRGQKQNNLIKNLSM